MPLLLLLLAVATACDSQTQQTDTTSVEPAVDPRCQNLAPPQCELMLQISSGVLNDTAAATSFDGAPTEQEQQKQPAGLMPINSVDAAIAAVDAHTGQPEDFRLAIAESLLDPMGLNMAVIGDRVLARGWMPNSFEQQDGYRVYQYKNLE